MDTKLVVMRQKRLIKIRLCMKHWHFLIFKMIVGISPCIDSLELDWMVFPRRSSSSWNDHFILYSSSQLSFNIDVAHFCSDLGGTMPDIYMRFVSSIFSFSVFLEWSKRWGWVLLPCGSGNAVKAGVMTNLDSILSSVHKYGRFILSTRVCFCFRHVPPAPSRSWIESMVILLGKQNISVFTAALISLSP